jgi:hypothetical protein
MVRLLGHLASDVADDCDLVRLFLCSLTLGMVRPILPVSQDFDWAAVVIKFLCEFDVEKDNGNAKMTAVACEPFVRRLEQLPLARLAPATEDEAREWLARRIERERARIELIRDENAAIDEADEAEAPVRLAFETGADGERHRRYLLSNERLVNRRISEFLLVRKAVVNGTLEKLEHDFGDPELQAAFEELKAAAKAGAEPRDDGVGDSSGREWATALALADGPCLPEAEEVDEHLDGAPQSDLGGHFPDASDDGVESYGADVFVRIEPKYPHAPADSAPPSGPSGHLPPPGGEGDESGGFAPSSCPAGHLPPRGGEGDEGGDSAGSSVPSGHLPPRGGEGDQSGGSAPSSCPAGHLPPRGGQGERAERMKARPLTTDNGPLTLEADNEPLTNEAKARPLTTDNGPLTNEGPLANEGPLTNAGPLTYEAFERERAKVRAKRAERLRQLNEQARRELEAARAIRRARRAERRNRKAAACSPKGADPKAETVDQQLDRQIGKVFNLQSAPIVRDPTVDR